MNLSQFKYIYRSTPWVHRLMMHSNMLDSPRKDNYSIKIQNNSQPYSLTMPGCVVTITPSSKVEGELYTKNVTAGTYWEGEPSDKSGVWALLLWQKQKKMSESVLTEPCWIRMCKGREIFYPRLSKPWHRLVKPNSILNLIPTLGF